MHLQIAAVKEIESADDGVGPALWANAGGMN
jgi:hypothetical protein